MATIALSELQPAGSSLFSDSESFMTELSDSELTDINGGVTPGILSFIGVSSAGCGAVVSAVATGVAYTIWGN